jgi:hypothetical protein
MTGTCLAASGDRLKWKGKEQAVRVLKSPWTTEKSWDYSILKWVLWSDQTRTKEAPVLVLATASISSGASYSFGGTSYRPEGREYGEWIA